MDIKIIANFSKNTYYLLEPILYKKFHAYVEQFYNFEFNIYTMTIIICDFDLKETIKILQNNKNLISYVIRKER